jgi:hypothetical protein
VPSTSAGLFRFRGPHTAGTSDPPVAAPTAKRVNAQVNFSTRALDGGHNHSGPSLSGSTRRNSAAVAVVRQKPDRHAAQVLPVLAAIRAEGITTHAGIARELNARGVPTPRGGRWTSASVRNLLSRTPPETASKP